MPTYNKLFDAMQTWNIFNDGEITERDTKDDRVINSTNEINTESNSKSDRRYSEMPQNQLQNIADGSYLTDYNLDNMNDSGSSKGSTNTNDNNVVKEIIKRSPADKINIYKNYIESKNNVYSMIFKDLDSLFYQLV